MERKASCADRMKIAMERLGMKPVDLCNKTRISKSTMSQYLSGEYEPSQERLEILSKALNVPEAWLMGYDLNLTVEFPLSQDESEILTMYRIAEPKIKEAVRSVLKSCASESTDIREKYKELEAEHERTHSPHESGSA